MCGNIRSTILNRETCKTCGWRWVQSCLTLLSSQFSSGLSCHQLQQLLEDCSFTRIPSSTSLLPNLYQNKAWKLFPAGLISHGIMVRQHKSHQYGRGVHRRRKLVELRVIAHVLLECGVAPSKRSRKTSYMHGLFCYNMILFSVLEIRSFTKKQKST